MTEIKYENGVVVVSQYGVTTIRFRPCDLDYDSRTELLGAVWDMPMFQEAGDPGFLKTQPVEERQKALEEVLGVSFPCGTGEEISDDEGEQIIEAQRQYYRGESDTLEEVLRRIKGGE